VTPHFQRAYRKLPSKLQDLADERDQIFRNNAFDLRLRTHALKGRLKGLWSYSIDARHRILFEFTAADAVLYHDIGSHDIYR
jgi:mRNA-degrading endonuclease YafQ of YafQ-DinJ toxin-antitoxin module